MNRHQPIGEVFTKKLAKKHGGEIKIENIITWGTAKVVIFEHKTSDAEPHGATTFYRVASFVPNRIGGWDGPDQDIIVDRFKW